MTLCLPLRCPMSCQVFQFTCQDVATEFRKRLHLYTLGAIEKTGVSSQVLVCRAAARIKHMEHGSLSAAMKHSFAGLAITSCRRVTASSSMSWEMPYYEIPNLWPRDHLESWSNTSTPSPRCMMCTKLFRDVAQTIFGRYDELSSLWPAKVPFVVYEFRWARLRPLPSVDGTSFRLNLSLV